MNAPTIEKYLIPKSNGAGERTAAITDITKIGILICFLVKIDIIIKAIKAQVKTATMNGEKFA